MGRSSYPNVMSKISRPCLMRDNLAVFVWLFLAWFPVACFSLNEAPFLTPQTFQTMDRHSYKTNVCERQRQLLAGNRTLRTALEGLNLTVAFINYANTGTADKHFFSLGRNGRLPDSSYARAQQQRPLLFVRLMDELARRAGFEWRNSFVALDPLNKTTGATWTDVLGWSTDHFDIAADFWAHTEERHGMGIAFPKGFSDGSIILMVPKLNNRRSFWSFLTPFHWKLWLLIGATVCITAVAYWLLDRLDPLSEERDDLSLADSLFFGAIMFTGHFFYRPRTQPAMLLSVSLTFWALVMASAYTANMASFLVTRTLGANTAAVVSIGDAITSGAPVCVEKNSFLDEFLSKEPELQLVRKETPLDVFHGLRLPLFGSGGGCAAGVVRKAIYEQYWRRADANHDCHLTMQKRPVQILPAGLATSVDAGHLCTSLIKHTLDLHIHDMIKDEFVQRVWEEHLAQVTTVTCKEDGPVREGETFSLNLGEMGGIFLLHGVLVAVSILLGLKDLKKRQVSRRLDQVSETLRSLSIFFPIAEIEEESTFT